MKSGNAKPSINKLLVSIITFSAIIFTLSFGSCTKGNADTPSASSNAIAADNDAPIEELPLPQPPSSIKTPEERAAYYINHFWDAMDFADSTRVNNRDFMEQNFSNYASFFPYADSLALADGVASLLNKVQSFPAAYREMLDVAEKYLYETNSPLLNEAQYAVFLRHALTSGILDADELLRPEEQLKQINRNRPGMKAPDFNFTLRNGRKSSLYKTPLADEIMLIFYDPDCDHCNQVIEQLSNDAFLAKKIAEKNTRVIAIYSGDNREMWDTTAIKLPKSWTVGFESGDLQEQNKYYLRYMPTIFLLDRNHKIKIKNLRY